VNLNFLPNLPSHQEHPWLDVNLIFLGTENYVLGRISAKAQFLQIKGGFSVKFRDQVRIKATSLMGKKIRRVTLEDIIIQYHGIELSTKCLAPSAFPRTYEEAESVGITT